MELRDFATETQLKYLESFERTNNYSKTAEELGCNESSVRKSLNTLEMKAIKQGYSPEEDAAFVAPAGFHVTGKTLRDPKTGNYTKTKINKDNGADFMKAAEALTKSYSGVSKKIKPPKLVDEDLCLCLSIGDAHLGVLSGAEISGEKYDLEKGVAELDMAAKTVIDRSPRAKYGIVANLGDFLHAADSTNRTKSGHVLDVSDLWGDVLESAVFLMKSIIDKMAAKVEEVHVYNLIGNHDRFNATVLSMLLEQYYSNNPRINIVVSKTSFDYYAHGNVLLGFTHGDTVKNAEKLGAIMSNDVPEMWGKSKFRKWHCGHVHHESVKMFNGFKVNTYSTISVPDAFSHNAGYRSERNIVTEVYHKKYGEIGSHKVDVSLAKELLEESKAA